MSLTDKVQVTMELGTFSTLVAGLYCTYSVVNPVAIPEYLWIEIAQKLSEYLGSWDYDKISLEDFIKYNLLIVPLELVADELDEYKKNDLYFERENGNAVLVITANLSEIKGD